MMNYVYFVDDIYRKEKRDQTKGLTNLGAMDMIAQYKPARYNKPDVSFHYNNSNLWCLVPLLKSKRRALCAVYERECV